MSYRPYRVYGTGQSDRHCTQNGSRRTMMSAEWPIHEGGMANPKTFLKRALTTTGTRKITPGERHRSHGFERQSRRGIRLDFVRTPVLGMNLRHENLSRTRPNTNGTKKTKLIHVEMGVQRGPDGGCRANISETINFELPTKEIRRPFGVLRQSKP